MVLRILLFAVIGLGSAGFGILGWLGLHESAATEIAAPAALPPETRKLLVAAQSLTAGSLIKPENVTGADIVVADIKPGAWADLPAARSELVGAMIRRSMSPNEVIMPADVMRPGDHGFLAAVLAPGARAISIGVDAVSGTAGLIWPGDRVDVILTQQIDSATQAAGRRVAGETVLRAARVIAIDQRMVQGAANSAADNFANKTVTVEVSPSEAERLSVAMRLGKLSLIVVAADQLAGGIAKDGPKTITWGGDVSTALGKGDGAPGNTIRVFHGTNEGKEFHF